MKEKQELGMGWYEFLRYFPFGLLRILSLIWVIVAILFFVSDTNIFTFIAIILNLCDFVFRVITHRHLENYSDKILQLLFCFYATAVISQIYSLYQGGMDAITAIFVPLFFYGLFYLINYKYFKNRSHIFVIQCSFLGKVKKDESILIKAEPSKSTESKQAIIKSYQLVRDKETEKYAKHLIENSYDLLSEKDAYDFIKIIQIYSKFGKEIAFKEFDSLANDLMDKERNTFKISFFIGALCANGIITNEETEGLNKKYLDRLENMLHSLSTNKIKNNYCRKCGEKLMEDSKFCHRCGTGVLNLEETENDLSEM